jgi:hypothetical protein
MAVGGMRRRRWFALAVPVMLLGLLAGSGTLSSATVVAENRVELRIGRSGTPDGFLWRQGSETKEQVFTTLDCVVSSSGADLIALSATKSSDATGGVVGLVGAQLGVQGVSENLGSTGQPCGEIDFRERLFLRLGADLGARNGVSASLRLLPRSGPRVQPVIHLLDAAGNRIWQVPNVPSINQPTTVAFTAPAAFRGIELTSSTPQDNRAYGLGDGSWIQLNDFPSVLPNCEVTDTNKPVITSPPSAPFGVEIEILTSSRKTGTPQDAPCVLPYILEPKVQGATPPPGVAEGDRTVLFDYPDNGWNLTFRWTTAWPDEAAKHPTPATLIGLPSGPFKPIDLCDGPNTLPATTTTGVPWCLVSQTVVAKTNGKMQVTDVYFGEGDPLNIRK